MEQTIKRGWVSLRGDGRRQQEIGGRYQAKVREGNRKYEAKLKKNHHQQNSISMLTRMATSSNMSNESVLFFQS